MGHLICSNVASMSCGARLNAAGLNKTVKTDSVDYLHHVLWRHTSHNTGVSNQKGLKEEEELWDLNYGYRRFLRPSVLSLFLLQPLA